ncbi:MAG TPA: TIGR00282 family metallophosphoesterase [Nitrospirota bacterium]
MNILFIGDIVGEPGRKAVKLHLSSLMDEVNPALVIANCENAAGGFGITPAIADELLSQGVDVLTSGNHIWDKKEIYDFIAKEPRLIRPANYPDGAPGRGSVTVMARNGVKVGVLNLMGRVFLANLDCPFKAGRTECERMRAEGAKVIFIDFHAEATSEKVALGRYLDGYATALVGTHTHIQTADERILEKGTAYLTDVGMTGPQDSVIGVTAELAIEKFLTQMPKRFDTAAGPGTLQAVVVTADPATGKAIGIERKNLT